MHQTCRRQIATSNKSLGSLTLARLSSEYSDLELARNILSLMSCSLVSSCTRNRKDHESLGPKIAHQCQESDLYALSTPLDPEAKSSLTSPRYSMLAARRYCKQAATRRFHSDDACSHHDLV